MDQDNLRHRSQNLRKTMTKEERHLWYDFLKTYPIQFKRQYPMGCYITDFYCYQAQLVVELDGSQHYTPNEIEYDRKRTVFLQSQGMLVLRISNRDVTERFRDVCEYIDRTVQNRMKG
jgi:very-short-patch-repair endonuclease